MSVVGALNNSAQPLPHSCTFHETRGLVEDFLGRFIFDRTYDRRDFQLAPTARLSHVVIGFLKLFVLFDDEVFDHGGFGHISSRVDNARILPAVQYLEKLTLHPSVTFIIGENGTGKSTLLEAIAVAWGFNPEGRTRNFNFSTRTSHSPLHQYLRLVKNFRRPKDGFFLRAESFFNVATEIENLDKEPAFGPPIVNSYGGHSLHEQSHGESFFSLFIHRFGGKGFYILDEPEAALSPTRQLAMITRLHELVEDNSLLRLIPRSSWHIQMPRSFYYQKME